MIESLDDDLDGEQLVSYNLLQRQMSLGQQRFRKMEEKQGNVADTSHMQDKIELL